MVGTLINNCYQLRPMNRVEPLDRVSTGVRGPDEGLPTGRAYVLRGGRDVGVTVILIEKQQSVTGEFSTTRENISYLADSILFMRYLEPGEIRKAVGVLKKRLSGFERTLREIDIDDEGLHIGDPMTELRGILTGMPEQVNEVADPPSGWADGPEQ